ncbi:MAG: carboxypeptidase regulatory-like domain-containing protein [Myxococcales bacterium]|nr:carboxypeptidase regulatory-like domain-containing protein [Myxococcales bacterium]
MRSDRATLCILLCLAGCGPKDENKDGIVDGVREPNNVSLVAPSTPVGTLSGQVLTTRLAALAEANVSVTVGSRLGELKTTTDAEGNFSFTSLPAGSQVLVTLTKAGYATLRASATIPSTAGNFPINNGNASVGPFTLTQLNGSLKFLVITRGGKPAKGVRVVLEAAPAGTLVTGDMGSYGTPLGLVVADGTVDDTGLVSFGGIPAVEELSRLNGRYDVTVSALDEDGDGLPEYAGTFQRYPARSLLFDTSLRTIELADARSSAQLNVTSSNVGSMIAPGSAPQRNMVLPGESLYFVFNQEVMPDNSLVVRLTDEIGVQSLTINKTLRNGYVLIVQPTSAIEQGREYNVSVRATSLDNGSTFFRAAYFFGGSSSSPKPFALSTIEYKDQPPGDSILNNGETVVVNFNQPIRLIGSAPAEAFVDYDFNTTNPKGSDFGEKGFQSGFLISASEPMSEPDALFALAPSGYTTRYVFTFGAATVGVANQTPVEIAFSKLLNAQGGYQTIWGVPVTADESSALKKAQ